MRVSIIVLMALGSGVLVFALSGCGSAPAAAKMEQPAGVSPQTMADALHAVMSSDRTVYTKFVVNRLQNEEKVIKASEHWKDQKTLPLPAQMFRMGAEMAREKNKSFSYTLQSIWPINKQNAPKTDVEKEGLKFVVDNPEKNFYKEEVIGNEKFFTAVYADKAVANACVTCHNTHEDSPKTDFKLNDIMGGVVIRIPLSTK